MTQLRSALEHYRRQRRIAAITLLGAQREAQRGSLDRLLKVVAAGQISAATDGAKSVDLMLAEQNIAADPEAAVDPLVFAGVASDGRPLRSLLELVVRPSASAGALDRVVLTQVSDAGRGGASVATAVRPRVGGYVRMLVPPSCGRCAILAGRYYRWSSGFQRHPRCFPAGTVVSGPAADGATRRWYEGELVVIRTAGGKELSATGNHPVLTDQGWLPANMLAEGSNVVSRASGDRSGALLAPDHDQMPSRIEDVWASGGMDSLGRVPVSAEDFHGDGFGSSDVDVVLADRFLRSWGEPSILQELREERLAVGPVLPVSLADLGSHLKFGESQRLARSLVRGPSLGAALRGGHLASSEESSFAWPADYNAIISESPADRIAAYSEAVGDGVFALPGDVSSDDPLYVDGQMAPRWDAPADAFSMESRGAYSEIGNDLRLRLSGKVELDRVIEVSRVKWSGHVYNLTSREGWYDANGIIVSNCDCRMIPSSEDTAGDLRTDPREYFDSLPTAAQLAERYPGMTVADRVKAGLMSQEDAFTVNGARAIRDGADPSQVMNARAGMSTAQVQLRGPGDRWTAKGRLEAQRVYGRDVFTTTEGTTRRGTAYKAMRANTRWGQNEDIKLPGERYSRARAPRLMPESIYAIAENRADAIRLLRINGFITD